MDKAKMLTIIKDNGLSLQTHRLHLTQVGIVLNLILPGQHVQLEILLTPDEARSAAADLLAHAAMADTF